MILAIHNGKVPPGWAGMLVLAEKWSCPPWMITGETVTNETRRRWYARGVLYYTQLNKRAEIEAKKWQNP